MITLFMLNGDWDENGPDVESEEALQEYIDHMKPVQ